MIGLLNGALGGAANTISDLIWIISGRIAPSMGITGMILGGAGFLVYSLF
jgi:hypothetical protein